MKIDEHNDLYFSEFHKKFNSIDRKIFLAIGGDSQGLVGIATIHIMDHAATIQILEFVLQQLKAGDFSRQVTFKPPYQQ